MGVSAAWTVAAVMGASAVDQHQQASAARRQAERNAATQRDALAALQQEGEPAIPLPDDAEVRRSRRRSITAQMRRRGRASTILTDTGASDSLGT